MSNLAVSILKPIQIVMRCFLWYDSSMNTCMNNKVVRTVRAKMKADGVTQEALAKRLGMERTNLVRLVNGHVGSVPKRWQQVLDELGLELVAVPKGADTKRLFEPNTASFIRSMEDDEQAG